MSVRLYGYRYSVYSRVVHMTLFAKQVPYQSVEVNPFSDLPDAYLQRQPFGRVPVLEHGTFALYETAAITRYVDRAFSGTALQPSDPVALARLDQVIAIVDSYGYVPLVRQVFSHAVFRPLVGEKSDPQVIESGLTNSYKVLTALEVLADEGLVLTGSSPTLADCHLAPMMDYFLRSDVGRGAFDDFPALKHWWEQVAEWPMLAHTDPDLSALIS